MAPLSNGTMPDAVSSGANNYFVLKSHGYAHYGILLCIYLYNRFCVLDRCTLSYDLLHNIMFNMLYIRNFLLRSRGVGGWVGETNFVVITE